ncbi:glycerol-3-phosphate acyltransferase RAM2-like [Tasmannia lanceolata]|uniref:glycerol-3-phosphate acyltransferase RAM2-like n=1 Tax=Tasmannia lanceolata TaxID=3420 RepID=UPI0040644D44
MFPSIEKFNSQGREKHSIVSELDNTLLISKSPFPYFMLVAFEAGDPIRALLLLMVSPIVSLLENLGLTAVALRIMIFVAMAGLRANDIKAVAKAVLPKFYLEDLRENAYKVFSSCGGKKYVVSSSPRIMAEAFLREYLDVDCVIGTEVRMIGDYCLGLVAAPGDMVGICMGEALGGALGDGGKIDVGLSDGVKDQPFMLLAREGYVIPRDHKSSPLPRKDYPKPLIFHDGRFIARPTPLDSLAVFLWLPMGVLLAISRILVGIILPYKLGLLGAAATGLRIRANLHTCQSQDLCTSHTCAPHKPSDPNTIGGATKEKVGTLYVCSHRTLVDPVIVSASLQRHVTAVTYSVSSVSELLSPIRTVRLSRDRTKDGEMMQALLKEGDLVVCPEGTTCREPYLLRFSPLFAEVAEAVVPVAVVANGSMFHGNTVRGYKWLDSFFFMMNPSPCYNLEFLEMLPKPPLRESLWKSSYDVANHVQRVMACALGFECTSLTRRDKYRMLAGNDGVGSKS